MNTLTKLGLGSVAIGGVALGAAAANAEIEADDIEEALSLPTRSLPFSADMIAELPDPVQRYFRHALAAGAPLARTVKLELSGSMNPGPRLGRLDIRAGERLTPLHGLVWRAQTRIGPLPFRITDWYFGGEGRMRGTVLGALPVLDQSNPDESRAARHRVAAESVWAPGATLSRKQVSWTALSEDRIVCLQTFDGESIRVEFGLDARGAVEEVTMQRHGDIGVPDWQLIPYGFRVEKERTFAGTTIPAKVTGGWWYGTDRYDAGRESTFVVDNAQFG